MHSTVLEVITLALVARAYAHPAFQRHWHELMQNQGVFPRYPASTDDNIYPPNNMYSQRVQSTIL